MTKAIIQALNPCQEKVLTLTFDNGKEFAGHQTVAKRLKAECFLLSRTAPGNVAATKI